ncbi:MAG: ECF transporter S component [Clostridia bacterium]|nr:ECF transporter S component [Clostridia bacterium]
MNRSRTKKKQSIRWMTGTAMMVAVTLALANTPLGLIRLPFLTATTLHIPVIIATLVLGLEAGVITGIVFGVNSLISNLTNASFFAPFFINPLVSVLPRLLFPFVVYAIAKGAKKLFERFSAGKAAAYVAASAIGTAMHTTMVMGMIYLLNAQKIADMLIAGAGVPQALVERGVGVGIAVLGVTNGVPEMIVAAVIAPVVALALDKAMGRMRESR